MPLMRLNKDFTYALKGFNIVHWKKGIQEVPQEEVKTILQEGLGTLDIDLNELLEWEPKKEAPKKPTLKSLMAKSKSKRKKTP